jgi:hypothetical protein
MTPRAPSDHELAKSPDWARARRARQLREARLPKVLRGTMKHIRDESLRDNIFGWIDGQVLIRLGRRPMIQVPSEVETPESRAIDEAVREICKNTEGDNESGEISWGPRGPLGMVRQPEIHPIDYHETLDRLAADETFFRRLRRKIRDTLRNAHVQGVAPEVLLGPSGYVPDIRPKNGRLVVPSDIGLGTASYLEGGPEGWHAWAVHEIGRRADQLVLGERGGTVSLGLDDALLVDVLDVHAGPGGFARAVAARGAPLPAIRVYETDPWYGAATSLSCVVSRNPVQDTYDFIVSAMPAPAMSDAAGHQRIYSGVGCRRGAPGPRKWLRDLGHLLRGLSLLLTPGGAALFLLPLGVRAGQGYVEDERLRRGVEDLVRDVPGLQLDGYHPTEEDAPVNRPFVGKQRPPLLTVVLKKPGVAP